MGASMAAATYHHPDLFDGLHTLDLLELSGSMAAAAARLNLSQPTISRRYQQLCRDFGLKKGSRRCIDRLRYGETDSIRLLRRAFQSHRLGAGVLRVGADPLRQGLLGEAPQTMAVPALFRRASTLHHLVCSHILDGALVSSLEIPALFPNQPDWYCCLDWVELGPGDQPTGPTVPKGPGFCSKALPMGEDCLLIPLGSWQLGLVAPAGVDELPSRWSEVVVPPFGCAPGLAAAVRQQQWMARQGPQGVHAASCWRRWLETERLACIATPSWFDALHQCGPDLRWLHLARPIREEIWLLVERTAWSPYPVLVELVEAIQAAISAFHASDAYCKRQYGGQLVC
jgi:hypothetical protein